MKVVAHIKNQIMRNFKPNDSHFIVGGDADLVIQSILFFSIT
jgi:5'-3' exonuclease